MGAYDDVRCEYPMPVTKFQGRDFQTMDGPNRRDCPPGRKTLTIRADGRLALDDEIVAGWTGRIVFYATEEAPSVRWGHGGGDLHNFGARFEGGHLVELVDLGYRESFDE